MTPVPRWQDAPVSVAGEPRRGLSAIDLDMRSVGANAVTAKCRNVFDERYSEGEITALRSQSRGTNRRKRQNEIAAMKSRDRQYTIEAHGGAGGALSEGVVSIVASWSRRTMKDHRRSRTMMGFLYAARDRRSEGMCASPGERSRWMIRDERPAPLPVRGARDGRQSTGFQITAKTSSSSSRSTSRHKTVRR